MHSFFLSIDETFLYLSQVKSNRNLEAEAWIDLASIYAKVGLRVDSNSCLDIAKSLGHFSPKFWHAKGQYIQFKSFDPKNSFSRSYVFRKNMMF